MPFEARIPNAPTRKALRDAEAGRNMTDYASVDGMFKDSISERNQGVTASLLPALNRLLFASIARPQELRQTLSLDWPKEGLSHRLMIVAHRFVERKFAEAPAKSATRWGRLRLARRPSSLYQTEASSCSSRVSHSPK